MPKCIGFKAPCCDLAAGGVVRGERERVNQTDLSLTIGAIILSTDNRMGKLSGIIINPRCMKLTNLIVHYHYIEYLIPTDIIIESSSDFVTLGCKFNELKSMAIISTDYILSDDFFDWERHIDPVTYAEAEKAFESEVHLPEGELPIRRNNRVYCTDRKIGSITKFEIECKTKTINYIYVHESYLHHKRKHRISAHSIDEVFYNCVYLKLSSRDAALLPANGVTY